jgi:hypothetical protein
MLHNLPPLNTWHQTLLWVQPKFLASPFIWRPPHPKASPLETPPQYAFFVEKATVTKNIPHNWETLMMGSLSSVDSPTVTSPQPNPSKVQALGRFVQSGTYAETVMDAMAQISFMSAPCVEEITLSSSVMQNVLALLNPKSKPEDTQLPALFDFHTPLLHTNFSNNIHYHPCPPKADPIDIEIFQ